MFLVDEGPIEKEHDRNILADSVLVAHVRFVNAGIDCLDKLVRIGRHIDDNHLVELRLQVRLLNGTAASLLLGRRGYWHPCFTQIRDMLETYFLLDLFGSSPEKVSAWRTASESERIKNFGPYKVRQLLDIRDGNTEKKREKAYKLLCNYAAHPTPEGFAVISPGNLTQIGPYPSANNLKASLEELCKHLAMGCEVSIKLQENRQIDVTSVRTNFLGAYTAWKSVASFINGV